MNPGVAFGGAALVGLGGAVGAVVRHLIGEPFPASSGFPWVTLWINVVGSWLLAAVAALPSLRRMPKVSLLVGPGVLGGFTTMSAHSWHLQQLVANDQPFLAAGYLLGTLLAGLAGIALIRWLASAGDCHEAAVAAGEQQRHV